MKQKNEWRRWFQASNLSVSYVRWGFAVHVLAPVWFASLFPYFQEWLMFGLADSRARKMVGGE